VPPTIVKPMAMLWKKLVVFLSDAYMKLVFPDSAYIGFC
jgi:hypothetical protein